MFKKENFTDDFIKFDNGFEIDENLGNQIILGPNGIGKSTIYNTILKIHPEYEHIDYEQLKSDFLKNKNKLIIGAQVAELASKYEEKEKIINRLHIKDNFKSLNITTQKGAKSIFPELNTAFVNNEDGIITFKSDKVKIINSLKNTDNQFLIFNYANLLELGDIENELEHLKNEFIKSIYSNLEKILDEEDCKCPVCGKVNDKPIKQLIKEKNKELTLLKSELLRQYQHENYNLEPEKIIENIKKITECISNNNIMKEDIISYFICGGNEENMKEIDVIKPQLIKINSEIKELEKEKEQYYNSLRENEIAIKEIFKSKFNVSFDDVEFNDNEKYVEITLPRNVEKYSTGEVNLMVFTFTIYQFIASNKEILIVDDPLSSYDISNQYRIMFDLVQASSSGKKVIILTHNIDCINIANTRHRNIFKYRYIYKVGGILCVRDINLNESDSVLSISNLLAYVSTDENKDKYFKLLIEREDDLQAPENLVFHYDRSYSFEYENVNLTNEYFVSLIDNLDNNFVYNKSFEQNAIDKIFYMTAIRIWIEEKFYQNNPNDNSLNGKTFGEKIEYMFPKNGQTRWKGSSSVTRKYLMSKKTMINQHNHYKSQILPFNYALNITLDELKNEILDIKNHFNN